MPYKSRPKKICVRLFFVLMVYIKYLKFQVSSSSGSLVLQTTKGVTDRRTDGQTDRWTGPNQYAPSTYFKLGGGAEKPGFSHDTYILDFEVGA